MIMKLPFGTKTNIAKCPNHPTRDLVLKRIGNEVYVKCPENDECIQDIPVYMVEEDRYERGL